MPCMCWYIPSDETKKKIKDLAQALVDEVKRLNELGDPLDCSIQDIHILIDHLYRPLTCEEKQKLNLPE